MTDPASGPLARAPEPEHWFFTFGFSHVHPKTGESLAGCFTVVPGSFDAARAAMYAMYKQKWSMQYPSREAAGVERYKLREIPWETTVRTEERTEP